jgi:hypothetical protein
MTTRERLQDLFGTTWESNAEFQAEWARFAARPDHTVRMIDPPLPLELRWLMPHMNCFSYALGLHGLPAYHRWIREHHALECLDGEFMRDLVERPLLVELLDGAPRLDSLVIYYRAEHIAHCGVIIDGANRVRSKFNVNEFYEHGLREVQTSYGEPRLFLKPVTNDIRRQIVDELELATRE